MNFFVAWTTDLLAKTLYTGFRDKHTDGLSKYIVASLLKIYPGANCVLQTLEISRFQIEKKEKKYTLHFKTIFQKSLYIFELGCTYKVGLA